ncbi:Transcriptional regulator PadR-like family protein [Reichenbachiella faecimaris]|uniref:Transcriptional regulator PadR-like family protein n=1 Tax=Reichenbachiella faecimaris TaxID=692418 RepID=A0A1W2G6S3_REIFA|nr:PadR family transcriptional regulator [Reichenbachiella faecimaris]SMD32323.1 Transcriptional regulator PadR-like family protein [Reichenbachiella faecimaris]
MKKTHLGEFEELVLTMVGILVKEAYGSTIVTEIKQQLDRTVNLSAVHITLYRLEDKGLIKSEMRGATAQRGGRRKRYFELTQSGLALLREVKAQRSKLWELMPQLNFSGEL